MEDPNPTVSIPMLPNDVIIEILTRLPVKPLLKFRCVCKYWRALISSQEFVRSHLKISKSDPSFSAHKIMLISRDNVKQFSVDSILYGPFSEAFELDCSIQVERKIFRMVGSCDGLVCLATDAKDLILWNPCTRLSKKLPDFSLKTNVSGYFTHGFGFAESSGDYKVVAIFFNMMGDLIEVIVQVYSLRSDKWKRIKNYTGPSPFLCPAKFVNGKLYWLPYPHYELGSGRDIVSFDLEEEEFEILQMPSYVKSGFYISLEVAGGSLYVLCHHLESADVWITDGGSRVGEVSLTKVGTIPCIGDFFRDSYKPVLYVLKNGQVLFLYGLVFVIFDSKDCSFRFPEMGKFGELVSVGGYLESLVSPVG